MNTRLTRFKPSACPYPVQTADWDGWDDKNRFCPSADGLDLHPCTLEETEETVSALIDTNKGRVLLLLHGTPPDRTKEELVRFAALIEELIFQRLVQGNPSPIF